MDDIATKIKELRKKLGLNQAELASELGVHQSTITKYEKGKTKPKGEPNQKLAALAGQTLGEWLGVEPVQAKDVNAKTVRVVGALCAGEWQEAIEWPYDDQYDVPALLDPRLPPYPLKGYVVRGTSMNRVYPDGSVVFAAATIANKLKPASGDHVLVMRRNKKGEYEASLKEYVVNSDGTKWLWPRSHDPAHQAPIQYKKGADEVTITGIVQASFVTGPRR